MKIKSFRGNDLKVGDVISHLFPQRKVGGTWAIYTYLVMELSRSTENTITIKVIDLKRNTGDHLTFWSKVQNDYFCRTADIPKKIHGELYVDFYLSK